MNYIMHTFEVVLSFGFGSILLFYHILRESKYLHSITYDA